MDTPDSALSHYSSRQDFQPSVPIQPVGQTDNQTADRPTEVSRPERMIGPTDFTEIVERLAEARETARPHSASLAIRHEEFGAIALKFEAAERGLSVAMASADPEFARTVAAALPMENRSNPNDTRSDHGGGALAHSGRQPDTHPRQQQGSPRDQHAPFDRWAPTTGQARAQNPNTDSSGGIYA